MSKISALQQKIEADLAAIEAETGGYKMEKLVLDEKIQRLQARQNYLIGLLDATTPKKRGKKDAVPAKGGEE